MRRDFQTYDAFARASLNEIYPDAQLSSAYQVEVNTLESGTLINDGTGRFTFQPLPGLAQVSPGYGLALTHLNEDAHADLVLLQNHYTPQRETTRMSAGVGVVLLGDGAGGFEVVWPSESGFAVVGDGKALASTWGRDGRQQLLAAQNNDRMLSYAVNAPLRSVLVLRLLGQPGNRDAIGAVVTLLYEDDGQSTAEIVAGSGYLSQSAPLAVFGIDTAQPRAARVRWPDGSVSEHGLDPAAGPYLELTQPKTESPAVSP